MARIAVPTSSSEILPWVRLTTEMIMGPSRVGSPGPPARLRLEPACAALAAGVPGDAPRRAAGIDGGGAQIAKRRCATWTARRLNGRGDRRNPIAIDWRVTDEEQRAPDLRSAVTDLRSAVIDLAAVHRVAL